MDTITRQDQYFDAMSGGSSEIPEPITRKEQYYAKMAGEDVDVPEPITREEFWLHKIIEHGGGGGTTTIEPLTVTENGSYSEAGKAYSPVNVSVPNPSTGSISITENGTYDVTEKASAVVNVSGGASNVVKGEFNFSTVGEHTINIPYEGNGFIKTICIAPKTRGSTNSIIHNGAIIFCSIFKMFEDNPESGTYNSRQHKIIAEYKSSASSAATVKYNGVAMGCYTNQYAVGNSLQWAMQIPAHSKLSIWIHELGQDGYGFLPDVDYEYYAIYSE